MWTWERKLKQKEERERAGYMRVGSAGLGWQSMLPNAALGKHLAQKHCMWERFKIDLSIRKDTPNPPEVKTAHEERQDTLT